MYCVYIYHERMKNQKCTDRYHKAYVRKKNKGVEKQSNGDVAGDVGFQNK